MIDEPKTKSIPKYIKLSDHIKILLFNIIHANVQIGIPTIPHWDLSKLNKISHSWPKSIYKSSINCRWRTEADETITPANKFSIWQPKPEFWNKNNNLSITIFYNRGPNRLPSGIPEFILKYTNKSFPHLTHAFICLNHAYKVFTIHQGTPLSIKQENK